MHITQQYWCFKGAKQLKHYKLLTNLVLKDSSSGAIWFIYTGIAEIQTQLTHSSVVRGWFVHFVKPGLAASGDWPVCSLTVRRRGSESLGSDRHAHPWLSNQSFGTRATFRRNHLSSTPSHDEGLVSRDPSLFFSFCFCRDKWAVLSSEQQGGKKRKKGAPIRGVDGEKKGMEGTVAMATHHHTGRPGTAVVISLMKCFFPFFFVLVKQTSSRPDGRRWRETLSRHGGGGVGGGG